MKEYIQIFQKRWIFTQKKINLKKMFYPFIVRLCTHKKYVSLIFYIYITTYLKFIKIGVGHLKQIVNLEVLKFIDYYIRNCLIKDF